MIPTIRLWILIFLGIPLGAVVYQMGSPWLLGVYNLLLALMAYVTYRLAPKTSNLVLVRRFDPVLSVRVPNRVRLILRNDGAEPFIGRLRDEAPAGCAVTNNEFNLDLASGREIEKEYTVTPEARGGDFFRGTFVRLECPLGLVQRQVFLNTQQPARIYPNVLALREFDLLKQKGRLNQLGIRKARARGLGMEFESLRDYSIGDDYRKIDWKASARRGDLVVRQFETEKNQAVILCIDVGRRMLSEVNGVTKLDHTLDACIMLAHAVVNAGDLIGLLVYSDTVKRYIPPRKGRAQVGAIIEALHDLTAEPFQSDPIGAYSYLGARWKRRSLLVTFTDLDDSDEARTFLNAFGPLAKRHIALVARVGDPNLKELASGLIDSKEALFGRAAALTFTADRKAAGTVMTSQDIHHLEAEPQDLAAALVSFYFEVKEKSLL